MRQRLEGVDQISISQSRQTAELTFASESHVFSAAAFRDALAEANVEVVGLQIDACGIILEESGQRWLAAGASRFLLAEGKTLSGGLRVCLTGRLNDQVNPHRLDITNWRP